MKTDGTVDRMKTFESFVTTRESRAAYAAGVRFASKGVFDSASKGMMLFGPTGVGKTHLLHAVGNYLVDRWMLYARFLPTVRIPRRDTDAVFALGDPDQVPVLLLDDVGAEKLTERALECLYILVDERLQRNAPMVVSTNYRPEDLMERLGEYGERLVGRLKEACEFVAIGGEDKRWVL